MNVPEFQPVKWRGYEMKSGRGIVCACVLSILGASLSYLPASSIEIPSAAPIMGHGINRAAEEWIRQQVAEGKDADLRTRVPFRNDPSDYSISATFLEEILTSPGTRIHRRGVRILNAFVVGPLDLENAQIAHDTRLVGCQFLDKMDLRSAHFRGHLLLSQSTFHDADFSNLTVDGVIVMTSTTFLGPADFSHMRVGLQLQADGTRFLDSRTTADFNSITVGGVTSFERALFNGPVEFGHASIGQLVCDGAHFPNPVSRINFNSLNVTQGVFFRNAVVAGAADFTLAIIEGNFEANGTTFTAVNFFSAHFGGPLLLNQSTFADANFSNLTVDGPIVLTSATFRGPANFNHMRVGLHFQGAGVRFLDSSTPVVFNAITVGDVALFNGALFNGPVDLGHARIGQLVCDGAHFANPVSRISFNSLNVTQGVFFRNAVVAGEADFTLAIIEGNFEANGTTFSPVSFNSAEVKGAGIFDGCVFLGPVILRRVKVRDNLTMERAKFADRNSVAEFNEIRVDGNVDLTRTSFAGFVDFSLARVGGVLLANGADFGHPGESANFSGMTVGKGVSFVDINCTGTIFFTDSTFPALSLRGRPTSPPALGGIRMSRTVIAGRLDIQNLNVQRLVARELSVGGEAFFSATTITSEVDLTRSSFRRLVFSELAWPTSRGAVHLDGMECRDLAYSTTGPAKREAQKLLSFLGGAPYDAGPYANLEASFRARGERAAANSVFVERKRRERKEPGCLIWYEKLFSWVGDYCLGYGRCPEPPLVCSILVILGGWAFGWVVGHMVNWQYKHSNGSTSERTPKGPCRRLFRMGWRSFWYTLGLFCPFGLGIEKFIELQYKPKSALVWVVCLRLAGLILVGAIVASLTGIMQ